ncbi:aldo/keto reductase [Streptomyces shenzhenensis]|uniref:NADP-dependent oxidoreductase domain-containing protein n=1 Tax=Streptomyces shenzhenensis TaxID=943815 RepID=A0A3M0I058_9ACTN|nr:hypothetical protein CTZ28_42360 [Streptomyces shenzhenensis]
MGPCPGDLLIAGKAGPYRDQHGAWGTAARPDRLRGRVEENLRRLGRDHLDVVNLRRMRQDSIAEHFGALAGLREARPIRRLGVFAVEPRHLAEALEIAPVVCVKNRYALDRPDPAGDELLRTCGERGIAFVATPPAGSGHAAEGALGTHHEEVLAVARAHGASPAQVRTAWTLHRGPYVLAIPATGDVGHLVENAAADRRGVGAAGRGPRDGRLTDLAWTCRPGSGGDAACGQGRECLS